MAALLLNPNAPQITIAQIVDAGQLGRAILALEAVNPGNVIAANTSDGTACTADDSLPANPLGRSILALDTIAAGAVIAANVGSGSVCLTEDCLPVTEVGRDLLANLSSPPSSTYAYLMMGPSGDLQYQPVGPAAAHYFGAVTLENGVIVQLT